MVDVVGVEVKVDEVSVPDVAVVDSEVGTPGRPGTWRREIGAEGALGTGAEGVGAAGTWRREIGALEAASRAGAWRRAIRRLISPAAGELLALVVPDADVVSVPPVSVVVVVTVVVKVAKYESVNEDEDEE